MIFGAGYGLGKQRMEVSGRVASDLSATKELDGAVALIFFIDAKDVDTEQHAMNHTR
jgi:hypothetical protein